MYLANERAAKCIPGPTERTLELLFTAAGRFFLCAKYFVFNRENGLTDWK
jgi:hypothetical protein